MGVAGGLDGVDLHGVDVVCAWCAHFGRSPAARSTGGAEAAGGTTLSHGLCRACRPLLLREWGLDGGYGTPRPGSAAEAETHPVEADPVDTRQADARRMAARGLRGLE